MHKLAAPYLTPEHGHLLCVHAFCICMRIGYSY